jgi:plastocyanin
MREKELTAGDDVIYRPAGSSPHRATVEKVNKTTVRICVSKFGQEVMMTVPKSDVYSRGAT